MATPLVPVNAVQLGTLQILVSPNRALKASWADLVSTLPDLNPKDQSDDRVLLDSLQWLIDDEAIGFGGSVKVTGPLATIRLHLVPADTPRSTWNEARDSWASKRKKHLKIVFDQLHTGWDEQDVGARLLELSEDDHIRMSELYATIPSPSRQQYEQGSDRKDDSVLWGLINDEEPEGIGATLYRYQFRSVAKMFQMETKPTKLVHPGYIPFTEAGRDGDYYVALHGNMEVVRNADWYDLPRGGILCEQMGTGKTLMCLSLIMATLHQICMPAPGADLINGTSTRTTSERVWSYPFVKERILRYTLGLDLEGDPRMPNLQELCADKLVQHDASAQHAAFLPDTVQGYFKRQHVYYTWHHPDDGMSRETRNIRQEERAVPLIKQVYLANSTIILVPQILLKQWVGQVKLHVRDSAVRMLVVEHEDKLCDVEKLITYDIILLSIERFAKEGSGKMGKSSELRRARWKRLILDEGQMAGSKAGIAMHLARELNIERRWVVSGTPTKHLQQGGENELAIPSDYGLTPLEEPTETRTARAWSSKDLNDVSRFGVIAGSFLGAEPYNSEVGFQKAVTAHIRGAAGPPFGAVKRLKDLMNALMVKHQPRVIDAEARLPPSTLEKTMLSFHPMQRLTYNALTALVTGNVYQSSPKQRSHFLHKANLKSFNSAVENLRLACFWYSAQELGAMYCLRGAVAYLDPMTIGERLALEAKGTYGSGSEAGDVKQEDHDMENPVRNKSEEPVDVKPDLSLLAEPTSEDEPADVKPDRAQLEGRAEPSIEDVKEAKAQAAREEARRKARNGDKTEDTRPDSYFLEHDYEQSYIDPELTLEAQQKLKEACRHLREALNTPGWSEWMANGISLPFEALPEQFPSRIRTAWSDSMDDCPDAIDVASLERLRELNFRGETEQMLAQLGWEGRAEKCKWFFEVMEKTAARLTREEKKLKKEGMYRLGPDVGVTGQQNQVKTAGPRRTSSGTSAAATDASARRLASNTGAAPKNGAAPITKSKSKKSKLDQQIAEAEENARIAASRARIVIDEAVPRVMPDVIQTTSRCAKINHIIKRMREGKGMDAEDGGDRFVIFGEVAEMAHVTEALSLINVKHTTLVSSMKPPARIESLRVFDEDPSIRVILLETKLAAKGLNLTSANRMIFLAPLWSLDIQAQAIKRVHRIGQTKPTHIEILAMRGTFEEDIVERAANLRSGGEEEMYTRAMIKPQFVNIQETPTELFNIPFVPSEELAVLASLASLPESPVPVPRLTQRTSKKGRTSVRSSDSAESDLLITPQYDESLDMTDLPDCFRLPEGGAGPGPSSMLGQNKRITDTLQVRPKRGIRFMKGEGDEDDHGSSASASASWTGGASSSKGNAKGKGKDRADRQEREKVGKRARFGSPA